MGLDITAYKNIKLVDVLDDMELWEERYDWKTTTYIHPVYVDDVHFI
jgi:TolB-like protein